MAKNRVGGCLKLRSRGHCSVYKLMMGFDSSDATCALNVYLPACQDTTDSIAFGGPSQFIKIDQVSDVSVAVEPELLKECEIHMMGITSLQYEGNP